MKSRRQFEFLLMALLFLMVAAGAVCAQDQSMAPPPPGNYSIQQGDQGPGMPQQGYPGPGAQQQGYPGPGAPQQGGPELGGQQQPDPPGRVARVQYMSGQVSMQPGGVNDWIAADMNRPLTTSDRVWTDKDSRAELNVGDGFIRMNSETSLTLTNVSDTTVQLEIDQGVLMLTVRHLERGEIYEVDTPNFAFTVMKTGVYRFDVNPSDDQSWVTVRSGYGEATGKGAAVRVNSGTQVRFRNGNSLEHTASDAPARDGFEEWAQVRDKRLDNSLSARYVSPGVIGYQDLDDNGSWTTTPDYGPVWTPNSVPAGWAPYRYGHWAWIPPWGWTWVDDAPWGFAPFHYGRWVYYGGGWGWAPGPLGYWNPYYAPALVGWIGGPGFGIGFGFGGWGFGVGIGFGWFPLGWGAPFYPHYCGWGHGGWYRGGGYVSAGYLHNVNVTNTHITNITNINNNYRSGNFGNTGAIARNGVTSASRAAFTSGAAVNKVGGAVPASALNNTHMLNTANVNPTKSSVLGGQSPRTSGVPSASATNRSVVTRATPPARPASFSSAQSATTARGNSNSTGRGASNLGTAANNAAHTGVAGENTAAHNTATGRGPTGTQTQARASVPNSPATRSVPRPSSTGAPSASSRSNPQTGSRGSASSVPRPPAGYSYHAAPPYSASAGRAGRASSAYGGNSRGYGSPSSSGRSYGSSPSYGSRSTGSSSAPHSSGGGASHGGGGGGGHGGGGGGHGR